MKKKYLIFTCLFSLTLLFHANKTLAQVLMNPEPENLGLVKWMTIEEADKKVKIAPKPLIIDFYTDWCGWCKHMMKTTFSNPYLAEYINSNFYPVRFNAETTDTIEFLGYKYYNQGIGKRPPHDFAVKMLNGKMSYPSTVFMSNYQNNSFQFSLLIPGYLDVPKIEPFLVFTVEYVFKTTQAEEFADNYNLAFYDSIFAKVKKTKWLTMNQAVDSNKVNKKKTIVFIHSNWCNSCKVMKQSTFENEVINKIVSKNYNMVDLNIESTDTINFMGQKFFNERTQEKPFHQFVYALSQNGLTLPSMVIFNEQMQVVNLVPYYMSPSITEAILEFFAKDAYKNTKWEDWQKTFVGKLPKK
ncbi:MAG: hypothetical protein A2X02_06095 [Bacteroidetes bacterium GWF2_29_10]|nr:MAG: hypothetical protein A2X02_06095 [Bacteroidetes bacterium GWF2_29_10]